MKSFDNNFSNYKIGTAYACRMKKNHAEENPARMLEKKIRQWNKKERLLKTQIHNNLNTSAISSDVLFSIIIFATDSIQRGAGDFLLVRFSNRRCWGLILSQLGNYDGPSRPLTKISIKKLKPYYHKHKLYRYVPISTHKNMWQQKMSEHFFSRRYLNHS